MEGTTASAGAPAPASPSTTTTSNGTGSETSSAESSPAPERTGPAPVDHSARMRDTMRRMRAPPADGTAKGAARDEAGRFTATPAVEPDTSAPPPKAEGGQPPVTDGEAPQKPADKSIPEAVFLDRLSRERKKLETLSSQIEERDARLAKADAAFALVSKELEALKAAMREGRQFDPRDDALRGHELANAARAEAERIDREIAERRQAEAQKRADAEAAEAVRTEINALIGQYPLASFDEVVSVMFRDPSRDLGATVRELHEAREKLGWQRVPPPSPPAPPAPTTSRSASSGPSAPMFAENSLDAMKATMRAWRASQRGTS